VVEGSRLLKKLIGAHMGYTPPVAASDIKKCEDQFLIFAALSLLGFVAILASFFVLSLEPFWKENRLWGVGSYIVFVSVLQMRFFNVKNNANPLSRNIPGSNNLRVWVTIIENGYSYIWILGFILIGVSRWHQI